MKHNRVLVRRRRRIFKVFQLGDLARVSSDQPFVVSLRLLALLR